MGLRDIGARLPPGFRFYPSDEELVCHYLYKKIANEEALKATLVEIDLHTCEPWQLPEVAKLNNTEWYFFSFRDRKYATGYRTNRATITGYWKATGKDRAILDPKTREIVGMRKTLVFYRNRAPNGIKTGWIMHEFRLEIPHMPPKEDWVLCRVFHKSKGAENNTSNLIDQATASSTSSDPSLAASPPPNDQHHTYPCGCQHANSLSSNNNPSSALNPNDDNKNGNNNNNNDDNNFSSSSLNPNDHHVLHHPKQAGISTCFSFSELINLAAEDDDDYGFLWDMDLEETSKVGEGVGDVPPPLTHQDLGDVRFDDDGGIAFF